MAHNSKTAAVAEYLLLRDKERDHWRVSGERPPSEASRFTTTYLALRALQTFGTAEQKSRIEERVKKVRGWLEKTAAKDTEDAVFRLWAMKRAGCESGMSCGRGRRRLPTTWTSRSSRGGSR